MHIGVGTDMNGGILPAYFRNYTDTRYGGIQQPTYDADDAV